MQIRKLCLNVLIIPHLTWPGLRWIVQHEGLFYHFTNKRLKFLTENPSFTKTVTSLTNITCSAGEILNWFLRLSTARLHHPSTFLYSRKKSNSRTTRSALRGDCVVPISSSSFGQLCFSVRASKLWNQLPVEIRNCTSHHTSIHCCQFYEL